MSRASGDESKPSDTGTIVLQPGAASLTMVGTSDSMVCDGDVCFVPGSSDT